MKLNIQLITILGFGILLNACGGSSGGGSNSTPTPTPTPQTVQLQVAAPVGFQDAKANAQNIPLVLYNNSDTDIQNPVISTINNQASANINYDTSSCSQIRAGSFCQVMANITGGDAGAFSFNANATIVAPQNNLSTRIKNHTTQILATKYADTVIGLTDYANSSDLVTVIAPSELVPSNGATTPVIVSIKMNSLTSNKYNTVTLVDVNGVNPIPVVNEVISGNSGAGATNFTTDTVVSLKANIPTQTSDLSYNYKIQLSECDSANECTNIVTSDSSYHILIAGVSTQMGVLGVYPQEVRLNKAHSSQIITLVNRGNATINKLVMANSDSLLQVIDNCGDTLAPGSFCDYTLSFDSSKPVSKSTSLNFTYSDNLSDKNELLPIQYTGTNVVNGLTLSDNKQSTPFNFYATTVNTSDTHTITIKNTGNVAETNINPIVTNNKFSFNLNGLTHPCSDTSNFSLVPNTSCELNLVYTSDTSETGSSDMTLSYNFATGSDTITQKLNYQTIEAKAVLLVTPISSDFGTIFNDNRESVNKVFSIKNIGNIAASAIQIATQDDNNLFNQVNNCSDSLASDASCEVTVSFGPTKIAPTNINGQLNIVYDTSGSGAITNVTSTLSGQIIEADSADFTISYTSSTGFAGGDGSEVKPFKVMENAGHPTIIYRIINDGKADATNVNYAPDVNPGWDLASNSCQNKPLKIGDNCEISYSMQKRNVGSNNITPSGKISFIDINHQDTITRDIQANPSYVYVYATPVITISPKDFNPNNIARGNSYTYVVNLSGGFNEVDNTIEIADNGPITGGLCTVNSKIPSCEIIINALVKDGEGDFTLNVNNSSSVAYPTTLTVKIMAAKYIFVSTGVTTGGYLGSFGDAKPEYYADIACDSDKKRPDKSATASYKALLLTSNRSCDKPNWVLQANQLYKNLAGSLVGKISTDGCMFNDDGNLITLIDNLPYVAWTGLNATQITNNAIWSSSNFSNIKIMGSSCVNWSSTDGTGNVGQEYNSSYWAYGYSVDCSASAHLYCVQQ